MDAESAANEPMTAPAKTCFPFFGMSPLSEQANDVLHAHSGQAGRILCRCRRWRRHGLRLTRAFLAALNQHKASDADGRQAHE